MATDSAPPPPNSSEDRGSIRWFMLTGGIGVAWLASLALLSLLTANPVTLNVQQVLEASDVVTAVVTDTHSNTIRVEQSWKKVLAPGNLHVSNLLEAKPPIGESLLIPLSESELGWQVTTTHLPGQPPVLYPATPEAEQQLRHILMVGRLPQ
jgi:hypothetical protein